MHCWFAGQQTPLQQVVAQRASDATALQVPPEQDWQTGQTIAVPAQTPFVQTSPVVQAFPSLQALPFGSAPCAGQFCGTPSQTAAAPHWPVAWRQTAPAGSGG